MAKARSEKNQADGQAANDSVEPMVIALAEQLGTFLGRVQAKADGWLENDALREQITQIRDGATLLLNRVNQTAAEVRKSVAEPAKKSPARPAAQAAKGRSGGTVDAPGKRHRKPPANQPFNKRMGEAGGKKAGQKQFRVGKSRGRG